MPFRPLPTRVLSWAVVVLLAARLLQVTLQPHLGLTGDGPGAKPAASSRPAVPERLLKEDPLLKAIALGDQGRYAESEAAIRAVIKTGDRAAARNALGVLHLRQDRLAAAQQEFDAALRLDAGYADGYFNRAGIRANQGDFPGALADYAKVIALKPEPKAQLEIAIREHARLSRLSQESPGARP